MLLTSAHAAHVFAAADAAGRTVGFLKVEGQSKTAEGCAEGASVHA